MSRASSRLFYIGTVLVLVIVASLLTAWYMLIPKATEKPYQMALAWGMQGSDVGQFNDPIGVAVTDNWVYVGDAKNSRIQIFDKNGNVNGQFELELKRPMNITVKKDRLYVTDYLDQQVRVYSNDGDTIETYQVPEASDRLRALSGVTVDQNDNILVTDFYGNKVLSVNNDQLQNDSPFGYMLQNQKQSKAFPTDVAVDNEGYVYVAQLGSNRINVYDQNRQLVSQWGGLLGKGYQGRFNSWFKGPTSIAVGPANNIFVADYGNNRVQKFSPSGKFLTSFGAKGQGQDKLHHPIGVDVDKDGTVYVVDYGHQRVTKWQPDLSDRQVDFEQNRSS